MSGNVALVPHREKSGKALSQPGEDPGTGHEAGCQSPPSLTQQHTGLRCSGPGLGEDTRFAAGLRPVTGRYLPHQILGVAPTKHGYGPAAAATRDLRPE